MSDYEFMESLGAHHPVTVSLTVAEAEQRERRGLPLPIGGDAESDQAKELLRIRREHKAKLAAETAAPAVQAEATGSPEVDVPTVESNLATASDDQSGGVSVRRFDPEWENFVLLKSINDSLLKLVKLTRGNVGGLPIKPDVRHKTSPSVDVPNGVVCDNPNPTEGDLHQGGLPSNKAGHLL